MFEEPVGGVGGGGDDGDEVGSSAIGGCRQLQVGQSVADGLLRRLRHQVEIARLKGGQRTCAEHREGSDNDDGPHSLALKVAQLLAGGCDVLTVGVFTHEPAEGGDGLVLLT